VEEVKKPHFQQALKGVRRKPVCRSILIIEAKFADGKRNGQKMDFVM